MKAKVLIFIIFSFLITGCLYSQWVPTGPINGPVYSLASNDTTIFSGASGSGPSNCGIFRSTNYGQTWIQTYTAPTYSFAINNSYIFAGTGSMGGVHRSSDNGLSWSLPLLTDQNVFSIVTDGSYIFAGTSRGVWLSTNDGQNWSQTALGDNQIIRSLGKNGTYIFAGCEINGLYFTTNYGQNWSQTSLINRTIWSLSSNGSYIFAGTWYYGVYLSTNNGQNWIQTSLNNEDVNAIACNGSNIFAGTLHGVYLSVNNGVDWIQKNEGLGNNLIHSITITSNYVFAGADNQYIYKRSLPEILGIEIKSESIPKSFSLYQNYPNPFNPVTTIRFDLPEASVIKLIIYDMLGEQVTTFANNDRYQAGVHSITVDMSRFPSGAYFYTLSAGNFTDTKKMILIK